MCHMKPSSLLLLLVMVVMALVEGLLYTRLCARKFRLTLDR